LHCKKVAVKLYQQITQTMDINKKTKLVYRVIYCNRDLTNGGFYDIQGLTDFDSYEAAKNIADQVAAEFEHISVKMIYVSEQWA
jgi:hypothetical protein